jgi:hypothetical protein
MKLARAWLLPAALALGLSGCTDGPLQLEGNDWGTDPPTFGPMNGRIVTTNNGADTLSVMDPVAQRMMGDIPVGFIPVELEGPHHVSADPAGQFFYINLSEAVTGSGGGPHGQHGTGTQPGYVLKLRASDGFMAAWARVDPNPGDNSISPDGSFVYATHYDLIKWIRGEDSNLAVVETDTMEVKKLVPLCPAAHGVRLAHDGHELYATCGPDEMAVVGLGDGTYPVRKVLLPGVTTAGQSCEHCPYAIGVAPDGTVWLSSLGPSGGGSGGGGVNIYDPAAGEFDPARRIDFCGRAVFAAFTHDPTAFKTYVPEQGPCGDFVRIYTPGGPGQAPTEAGHIGPFAPSDCLNAHMLLISADDRTGYLICEGDHVGPGTLVVLDLAAGAVRATLPVGVFPDGMAMIPSD